MSQERQRFCPEMPLHCFKTAQGNPPATSVDWFSSDEEKKAWANSNSSY